MKEKKKDIEEMKLNIEVLTQALLRVLDENEGVIVDFNEERYFILKSEDDCGNMIIKILVDPSFSDDVDDKFEDGNIIVLNKPEILEVVK